MDHNYHQQFVLLREEYRVVKESISSDKTMNGNFGDALWVGGTMTGANVSEPQATAACIGITPSLLYSKEQELPPRSMMENPPSETAASSTMGSMPSLSRDRSAEQSIATPSRELEPVRPRIGHKKSRAGCFNCKKRKIKCQENQPVCHNCARKNLKCVYPAPRTLAALRDSALYSPSPVASVNLQATPQIFTMTDMRLFHHFLLAAYPHLPVGNDTAWLSHVPLIAHHNEYLMHAILGMAASHLGILTGTSLDSAAMHHRTLAIRGTNEAMSLVNRTGSDGDALLASCYLLTFQSTYMEEGIPEFFFFVRGCALVSHQLRAENLPMAFLLNESDHFKYMEERLKVLPIINAALLDGAGKSLSALPPHFNVPVHAQFFGLLMRCIYGVRGSSLNGYFMFIMIYAGMNKFEVDEFNDFIDAGNQISQILIAHFLAIQMMLFPILDREWSAGKSKLAAGRMNVTWILTIAANTSQSLRHLLEWPLAIMEAVQDELDGKQSIVPKIEVLRKNEGLSVHI